jgi:hypothetical protein
MHWPAVCQVLQLLFFSLFHAHFFYSCRGKYTMLERDYSDNVDAVAGKRADCKELTCSLSSQVQVLLKMICSIAMMKTTMAEIGCV